MGLATIADLNRQLRFAGGKITVGTEPGNTFTPDDAELFLEDALALLENKYEDVESSSGYKRRLYIRMQCLEAFIMVINTYNKDVNRLNSILSEIERLEMYLYEESNYVVGIRGNIA